MERSVVSEVKGRKEREKIDILPESHRHTAMNLKITAIGLHVVTEASKDATQAT